MPIISLWTPWTFSWPWHALLAATLGAILVAIMHRQGSRAIGDTGGQRARPVVVLMSLSVSAACAWQFGPNDAMLAAVFLCASLLALGAIDARTGYLPDVLTLGLVWAGLLVNLGDTFTSLHSAVIGAVAGYGILRTIHEAYRVVRRREGMGHGDFKLLAALGAWMGWASLPVLVVIASAAALVWAMATALARRTGLQLAAQVHFGPYLAAAGIVTLFWQHGRFGFH